jgi:uncharacterized protein YlxP (DUF503 family)
VGLPRAPTFFFTSKEIEAMHVALLQVELRIPGCRSLKQKRSVIKRLINAVRSQHNVAIAEIDDHDMWGRAVFGLVTINNKSEHADQILQRVIREIGHFEGADLVDYRIERL